MHLINQVPGRLNPASCSAAQLAGGNVKGNECEQSLIMMDQVKSLGATLQRQLKAGPEKTYWRSERDFLCVCVRAFYFPFAIYRK